ncbi:hypothetical protein G7Y89_g14584 [Cudoniella acicularis]|uniref:FAD-binding PCMH-type domain-containing protein n=1 Tax=Cudoniella acicularis TaxID=354080 RepID=A0A8H4QZX6_9HELO|nr:hypothetical protein G7Y89_g14584 [Cudoniella acicularis]
MLSAFILSLRANLSSEAQILTDASHVAFKTTLERWSNEGLQIPGAIIRPTTERDVAITVKAAKKHSVPFVPASGGHSPWSTIDTSGFILDLGLLKSIIVEPKSNSVKIAGAVLVKELAIALSEAGRCTTLGNGNTVGVIPYCIGGGINILAAIIGFACDQILSAKIVTADGEIIETSQESEPELFWAIKGAGQFFGVVLELTLKTFPLSILGPSDGCHWVGNFVYSLDHAENVCNVLESLMVTSEHNTAGLIMVMAPPPAFQPMLAVIPHYFGDPEKAPAAFKALSDLQPLLSSASNMSFVEFRDSMDYACVKGDFKRFSVAGIPKFKTKSFLKVIDLFKELLDSCPDASASGYAFEWHTAITELQPQDSAFGFQDQLLWMNCFSWYHQPENHNVVVDFEARALAAMRDGQVENDFVDYPNSNRISSIERRYPGEARIEKLRTLKQKWDPRGIFTQQLL